MNYLMNKSRLSWIISVNKDILSDPLYCKELQSLVVRISVVQTIRNEGCTKKHQSYLREEFQTKNVTKSGKSPQFS